MHSVTCLIAQFPWNEAKKLGSARESAIQQRSVRELAPFSFPLFSFGHWVTCDKLINMLLQRARIGSSWSSNLLADARFRYKRAISESTCEGFTLANVSLSLVSYHAALPKAPQAPTNESQLPQRLELTSPFIPFYPLWLSLGELELNGIRVWAEISQRVINDIKRQRKERSKQEAEFHHASFQRWLLVTFPGATSLVSRKQC